MALTEEEKKKRSREQARKWRAENLERSRELKRKWRAENLEKVREQGRELKRKWRAENLEKAREQGREQTRKWRAENPERPRASARHCAANLTEGYVRGELARRTQLHSGDIPQALIELKRVQIQINRELKRIEDEKR
jgi:hypothetical protein